MNLKSTLCFAFATARFASAIACCSHDYKTCASWCGETKTDCNTSPQFCYWLGNGAIAGDSCLPRWSSGCQIGGGTCCPGLTCVQQDGWSQCLPTREVGVVTGPTTPTTNTNATTGTTRVTTRATSTTRATTATATTTPPSPGNLSTLVSIGTDNRLVYGLYKNTVSPYFKELNSNANVAGGTSNKVPDFSYVGYKGGAEQIPFVPAVVTLTPDLVKDDGNQIQNAINEVSALPLVNGFRGAILLKAGAYDVFNQLKISASGVVLRGEGSGSSGTAITYTKKERSNMILVSGSADPVRTGTTVRVTKSHVPTGARTFTVSTGHGFVKGTNIIIQMTPNSDWLLHMSNMAQWGWTTTEYNIQWKRVVTAVVGDEITIHAPIVQPIDSVYGGASVFAFTFNGAISNVGLENMRLLSSYASSTDENHGWIGMQMVRVQNSWIRQVTGKHFGHGLVSIEGQSSYITVEDCAMLDHKSTDSGGRRYSFNIDKSDFILFQRCLTRNGRHDYVSGSRTPGPNVWVDSLALDTLNDIGPHHRYATGQLYDNMQSYTPSARGELNVQNRAGSGSGHGWAGAQIMFWNCEGKIICDSPNGAMNWAVGTVGTHEDSSFSTEPNGIIQSYGKHVTPRSLYYKQLQDRLGPKSLRHMILPQQKVGTIWSQLKTWNGEGLLLDKVTTWRNETSTSVLTNSPLSIGGIVRDLSLLDAAPTLYMWTKASGPGTTTFSSASSLVTTASFSTSGAYSLNLNVTNSKGFTASATLSIAVS